MGPGVPHPAARSDPVLRVYRAGTRRAAGGATGGSAEGPAVAAFEALGHLRGLTLEADFSGTTIEPVARRFGSLMFFRLRSLGLCIPEPANAFELRKLLVVEGEPVPKLGRFLVVVAFLPDFLALAITISENGKCRAVV